MREPKDIFSAAGLDADKLELLEYLLEEEGIESASQPDSILHVERTESLPPSFAQQQLPLSFAQQRLWFLHQFEPDRAAYNIAGALRMLGQLDVTALSRSLDEILRRHESLHTSFVSIGGKPVQVIAPASHLALAVEELTALPAAEREAELRRLMREEAREAFDLRESPLLRARLLRLSEEEHALLLTMHHIVSDGWSLGVFARELAALYGAYINGLPSPLEELAMQYAAFAVWQQEHLTGEFLERQLDYWRQQLSGDLPVLELPTGRPRPPVQTFRGATETFSLPLKLREELKALALEEDATLFMLLLAAFQLLLSRYTHQRDILVGTPIAGRTRAEVEPLIGCFVNTLVLRTRLLPDESFRELLRRVRETCLGGYAHQEVPFERVVEELAPERSLSHAPLFQVMFALQNAPMPTLELPGLKLSLIEADNEVAKFDLSLEMIETPVGLKGMLHYNTDFFDGAMMARMAVHLQTLLEGIAANPDTRILRLPLLTEGELRRSLLEWNETAADYPRDSCINELFEAQVEKTPDAVALVFEGEQLTYGELNRRANQLAHYLRGIGVGSEVRVGILMDRSMEMIVALLGILKAGGAYLPLDPSNPGERLAFMIDDAAAPILLTQERHLDAAFAQLVVCLDADWQMIASEDASNPPRLSDADNLAYVIYTSGSTGQPKGVCVSHRAVNRLIFNTNYVSLDSAERVAQVSNSSFDAATFEIWGALLHGAELVIIERDVALSPQEFAAEILERRIKTIFLTTALFNQLARVVPSAFGSVRNLLFGGEAVEPKWVREILRNNPPERLLHVYGPTESTTFTTWQLVEDVAQNATTVAIGRPISNTRTYLLDEQLQPVPTGIAGELFIGGDGLARGYLNSPELTAEKFIPDLFGGEPGGRLYRTGDLTRYGPEGTIEFVGRRDEQVKLRGFRIELEEIKTVLGQHPAVRECLVMVREDVPGDKRLVAYLLLAAQLEPPSSAELRKHLREKLPDYMIPSAFVRLAEFSLTPNGKVDREALPAPEHSLEERQSNYVAPRSPVEETLAAIIADVLGIEQVGVYDNFFELGGHSLLATQVITRIREVLGVDVSLRQFFESPLIDELASQIEPLIADGSAKTVLPMRVVSKARALPLSFAQQRLWFLDQFESGNPIYNIPAALRLRGRLDVESLERTLNEIVRRHESLRTVFRAERGEPVQVILPEQPIAVSVLNLAGLLKADGETEAERLIAAEAQKGFDLARGPLLRATLLKLADEDHVLLFTMHHIISDGWSVGVLVHEMGTIYSAYVAGQESPLAELAIQYADFAQWQREWLQGEVLEEQLAYWKKQLAPLPPVLELPADRPRPTALTYKGATLNVEFSVELTEKLKDLSRGTGASLYMTLLAAFQTLLHRYTGQHDISVGSPIANRQRSEIEPLIGFFVNTLVMRTDLSGDPSFRELLRRVHEVTLSAYEHQDVPFEMLVEELQPERHLSIPPFFHVVFALQNAPGNELRLPHLMLSQMDVKGTTAKFDLSLLLEESAEGLTGLLEYSTDLFDEKTMRRLLEHFQTLLEAVVANPDEHLSALPLLNTDEGRRLIAGWNSASAEPDLKQCVHHLFERQVEKTPNHPALILGEQKLSYSELNRRANQLAHHLQTLGTGPDVVVAIMMERSVEMALGVLAVLKAGGAYLLLDPADPRERLYFMLKDAAASVVLTQKRLEPLLPEDRVHVCCPDADWQQSAQGAEENPFSHTTPDNLACLIYTSGSTGEPKAVALQHRPLVNLLQFEARSASTTDALRTLQLAAPSLDITFHEIFSTWCAGGTLVLAPEEARKDSRELWRILSSEKIERLFLPSARLQHLAESASAENTLPQSLRRIILTGEQLKINGPVRDLFGKLAHCTLEYQYMQPETQLATRLRLEGQDSEWPSLPSIGHPVENAQVFVLDSRLQPVPVGVAGELYIGGCALAREYLNRADETASRFIPHPFGDQAGARLYRTGDVARYRDDGRLEYLKRNDNQLMLRGHRVEMEEIETALKLHPSVKQAVVNPWEDEAGRKHLVAYLIAAPGSQPTIAELRNHLRERLPDYMMPSAFLLLDSLPLAPDGKPDRRALPAPVQAEGEVKEGYVAPRSSTEKILAGIWSSVLKIERVGIHDNFFDLGGHSLLATQLMSGVREHFHVDIPLRRLFEHPTVAALAQSIEESAHDRQRSQVALITHEAREENLPLSFAQQRLWFIHQLEPNNPTYHIASTINISGALNVKALEQSLAEIVRRHEVLRTSFTVVDGQPVQVIAPEAPFTLSVIDLLDKIETEQEAERQRLIQAEAREAFDLSKSPLLRARLLRLSDARHMLLFTMHHIISDGWSVGVMARELATLYEAYSSGQRSPLPELTVQYADFAVWQRERLTGEFLDSQLQYWKEQLAGAPPMLDLPTTRTRPLVQTFRGAGVPIELPKELTERLKALCRSEDATLFMLLLAAFQLLLSRYTHQRDILVGTPIAGRTRAEVEPLIGCFVNTLVLRTHLAPEESFRELLRRVLETCLGGYAHQEVPFERVVEELAPERSLSHAPLFQVMFALQNAPMPSLELAQLKLTLVEIPLEVSRFDLTLVLEETNGGLSGQLEYNTDLFDADAMARMIGHYRRLLESIIADAERPLSELELLTGAERRQLLVEWNDTAVRAASPLCAQQLFEQRVAQQPNTLAVVAGDASLTYDELNARANQLAHHLRGMGVRAETPVCICLERSVELIVSTLAVVKAGGAYVPLDPSYPQERLSFMLKDSRAPVLLTREGLRGTFDRCEAEVVLLDKNWEAVARQSVDNPKCDVAPGNLAYVIYTSGSTGQPKGVAIAHASLVNMIRWYQRTSAVAPGERFTQLAGIGFDASVFELWPNLVSGASCYIPDEETRLSPEKLRDWIVSRQINTCFAATPLAELLLALPWPEETALRMLHTGGDKLHRFPDKSFGFRVVNNYGPTESTVIATSGWVGAEASESQSPAIGRPIDNAEVYLLDQSLQPVPAGVRGELYVGGAVLARGYLNRPELTAEGFIPHPFSASPGARLYRTGDLARHLPDGQIEFLGRVDNQIKIRGHRIELGEIEVVLDNHSAVRESVVDCREMRPGEKRLTAYVVLEEEAHATVDELRGYLAERLPGYMVPSACVFMERLPLNANGKLDRQSLPAADALNSEPDARFVAPVTEMERAIAELWRELLGVEMVSVHDNFFDLGGHSLLLVQMQSKLQEKLEREIAIIELFQYSTISTLARHLSRVPLETSGAVSPHRERADARRQSIRGRARRTHSQSAG